MKGPYRLAKGCALDDLLGALCEGREVFSQSPSGEGHDHLVRSQGWRPGNQLGSYRAVEPVKSLFFRPREFVGLVPAETAAAARLPTAPLPRAAVGVKNCDLASLTIHDHVFLDSKPVDPGYAAARESTLIISADCTDCLDVCFCTAVGQQPHPRAGFDMNVAAVAPAAPADPLKLDYVIESGSERGEELLASVEHMLEAADAPLLARRDEQRAALSDRVSDQSSAAGLAPGQDLQGAIRESDDELWRRFAARCVECGACNFVCCTCHCFLLTDGLTADGQPARTKLWDACLFLNFARVAGGNPRAERAERLRNRFEKKFDFFKDRLGHYACDGCGRCTDVCTAKIDIREVLSSAVASRESQGTAGGDAP